MKRSLLRITLTALCLLLLTACGSKDQEESPEQLGFNEETNQTITFHGINFSIPAYYDFLDPSSTETQLRYYPENENYASQLWLYAEDTDITPADFRAGKQAAVEGVIEMTFASTDADYTKESSEDVTVAGLSGWHITFSAQLDKTSGTGHAVIIHSIYAKKIIMILQLTDSSDQSDFDYDADFIKILESATLVKEESKGSISNKPGESTDSPKPSSGEMIGSGNLGDNYVEIKGGQLATDYEGNPVCIITYSWTNNSDETTSAMYEISEKAFQDGVELDSAYFILDSSIYDSGSSMKDVRPGATADIQCAFVLANQTSDVEFELSELFNFSKNPDRVVKTYTIN